MEGAGTLPGVEVHETQVIRDDPFERVEVQRAFEARDGRDVPLLSEETHTDVVPQLRQGEV